MKMLSSGRETTAASFAGTTLLLFSAFFFGLRAYVTFVSRNPGASAAASPVPGFLEDFAFGALLGLLTFLTLAAGKRVYFLTVFPLEILVVLLSYANLQYINFYGDNIRLFDLEYIQNMGATWKETIRDVWVRPGELLFLLVPLAFLAGGGLVLHRSRGRGSGKKNILIFSLFLGAAVVVAWAGAGALKKDAEPGDFVRNNIWVGFLRDMPRLEAHIRTVRQIRATTAGEAKPGVQTGKRVGKRPADADPPFGLAGDEVRYSAEYPYVKIPRKDAFRIGLPGVREPGPGSENRARPSRNVVFIILESFRNREIGALGGAGGLTPCFDALAARGTLFTDFYGHCDMTAGAEFSALNSFYDIFKGVTVMRKHDRISLFSLPEVLGLFGYSNLWVNSWSADFDNSRSYFGRHGNFTILDKTSFPPTAVMSGWSYSDEDTMKLAVKAMDEAKKPFFALVLTATNHVPYEVPDRRFELGRGNDVFARYLNTFHYTDYALGRLFELIRDRDYFRNTIFFIFADTGTNRTRQAELEEYERCENEFHIPLLIYDPLDTGGRVEREISGQVDLAPTVLDMLGVRIANPFIGRSLLREADSPFYLAFHGRDVPWVRFYDRDFLCSYNVNTRVLLGFDRKSGSPRDVPPDRAAGIISKIKQTIDLGDWAIYNNRVWDWKINEFYRTLFNAK